MGSETKRRPEASQETRLAPQFNVVLLDDDHHTYEYVIEMLCAVFGHPVVQGYQMAVEVDSTGRAVVFTGHFELAELKQQQIHAYGADWRIAHCAGSMSAILEQAPR
ncbi:MAG: ATP-dependent Clp protease adaptor ClpS [Planctomycetes bacterium]|nr:ATP-dependent Clp protease adaptor ClpS [Planctomycetota bacterium]